MLKKVFYLFNIIFFPDDRINAYYRFNSLYYKGRVEQAIGIAREYLEKSPNDNSMKFNLALAYTKLKNHRAAFKISEELLDKLSTERNILYIYLANMPTDKLVRIITDNNYENLEKIPEFYEYACYHLLENDKIGVASKLMAKAYGNNIHSWYIDYLSGYLCDLSKEYNVAMKKYKDAVKGANRLYKKLIKDRIEELEKYFT